MNFQNLLPLTPNSTYYNSKKEIIEEGLELHSKALVADRELYTCMLFLKNSTYYTKSLIIKNLLSNSVHKLPDILEKDSERIELEDSLIMYALHNESITHALKMLLILKDNKINNKRTTDIILKFIFDRANLDMICIKYKDKIKKLIVHALGMSKVHYILNRKSREGKRLFTKYIEKYQNTNALETIYFVFNAKYTFSNKYYLEYKKIAALIEQGRSIPKTILPIEVVKGFGAFYGTKISYADIVVKANISDKQKIQLQNTIKRDSENTIELKIDYEKYSLLDLYKYLYSVSEETIDMRVLMGIIDRKSLELSKKLRINNIPTAIIVDLSISHSGSNEGLNHPFYRNMIFKDILKHFFNEQKIEFKEYICGGVKSEKGLLIPGGSSNLYKPFLQALSDGYKNFIFLSDGFSNVSDFNEIYRAARKIYDISGVHFNPVFSPKNMSCKELSDKLPVIPFRGEEDIQSLELLYLLNTDKQKFIQFVRKNIL